MSNTNTSTNNRSIEMLSIAGSVASIIALVIVLIQLATPTKDISTQMVIWRIILSTIALIISGLIIVVAYNRCSYIIQSQLSYEQKAIRLSGVTIVALFAVGVCLDGFFAALNWSLWLLPLFDLLSTISRLLKHGY